MSDSFAAPGTLALQAPPSTGYPRQECWSEWPFSIPASLTYRCYQTFVCFFYCYMSHVSLILRPVSSVTQLCPTLCAPMDYSMPGLPVHHQLLEFTQTHAHRVGDAIQPSHPLSSPFPPAPNPSQHQGLFQWVNSSHEMAKVLEPEEPKKR